MSAAGRTLAFMTSRLTAIPGWVVPSLRAVSRTEDFLLWLVGRTRAPAALGAWNSLNWLGRDEGGQTPGPLTRKGVAREVVAWAELRVAGAITDGLAYPPPTWWARRGIDEPDRMPPDEWAARLENPYERHFVHGTALALGWLLGQVTDPGLMAPTRCGDGSRIPPEDRAQYQQVLRALSEPARPPVTAS